MAELVVRLRRFEELIIPDVTAALLISMSAATMDRRLGPDRTGPTTPTMPGFAQGMVFAQRRYEQHVTVYKHLCNRMR